MATSARQCQLLPDRFVPVAGLPQAAGEPIEAVFPELQRCVQLGFKGCLLNPDPFENSGTEPPGLGERPGVGSVVNPQTGATMDHIAPLIEKLEWLTPAARKLIFEDNARRLFKLEPTR